MKKIGIYLIICIIIILFRENICFFYGNILGVFKLDNKYYDAIIKIKDEKINYLEKEYKELNEFSNKLYLINYNYKVSKIIYKTSYKSEEYIIQYGNDSLIKDGYAVMNEYGLIGKITKVDKITSVFKTIREINDISVKINDNYGKMNYDYDSGYFIIDDISNYDKVYVNDEVYTSGYGTIKENIYIGKVVKIENETISKKIYVESNVDFDNLNYVLIVGDFDDINT